MIQGELDEAALSRLARELSRPVKNLDWREFHFFKKKGLAKNNRMEIRVCLDYELAREFNRVIGFIARLSNERRQQMIERRRLLSRYVTIRFSDPKTPAWSDVESESKAKDFLNVPAACVAASWFPKPWLWGTVDQRRLIVKQLASVYPPWPLTMIEYPPEEDDAELLIEVAKAHRDTTLYVVAINRSWKKGAVLKAFNAWLNQQTGFTGVASSQGKRKFAAELNDLGCYRLMTRLDSKERMHAMSSVGFKRSFPKLSEGKKRAATRLRALGYL